MGCRQSKGEEGKEVSSIASSEGVRKQGTAASSTQKNSNTTGNRRHRSKRSNNKKNTKDISNGINTDEKNLDSDHNIQESSECWMRPLQQPSESQRNAGIEDLNDSDAESITPPHLK